MALVAAAGWWLLASASRPDESAGAEGAPESVAERAAVKHGNAIAAGIRDAGDADAKGLFALAGVAGIWVVGTWVGNAINKIINARDRRRARP